MNQIIQIILLGMAAGWLASFLVKSRQISLINYLIIGIIGSFIGRYLFGLLGIVAKSAVGTFVMTLLGAVVLLWLVNQLKNKR
jgi:uncharacterized membrane protein YeaQ/YmgE (transglycosylase-associated protein family)